MKVKIGKYNNPWISKWGYTYYMHWRYGEYFGWGENTKFENALESIQTMLQWVYDHTINVDIDDRPRKVSVKLDPYDTWDMDYTLSVIILPLLKQLKETNRGSSPIDLEDVPVELRTTNHDNWTKQLCFNFYTQEDPDIVLKGAHDRWEWAINEMIWTFEHLQGDTDFDELKSHELDRIENGTRLFGKYFLSLWD